MSVVIVYPVPKLFHHVIEEFISALVPENTEVNRVIPASTIGALSLSQRVPASHHSLSATET